MKDDKTTFKVTLKSVVYVNARRFEDDSAIGQMAIDNVEPTDWDVVEIEEHHESI